MSDSALERSGSLGEPAREVENGDGMENIESSELTEALEMSTEAVIEHLGELTLMMRQLGSRVGVGDLLAAHRALAAVDCTSRTEARLALRAVGARP